MHVFLLMYMCDPRDIVIGQNVFAQNLKDPLQTCFNMCINCSVLSNNLYLICSFHTKKLNYLVKIFEITSAASPPLKTQNL